MLSIRLESENGIVSIYTRVLKVVFGENYTKEARFYAVYNNNMPNVLGVIALYKNHRGTHHTQTIILYCIYYSLQDTA